jgi:chromosome segregation ATPase
VAQERDILHLNDRLTASENDRKEITERLIKAETEYAACREDRQTLHDSLHAVRLELGIVKALLKTQLSGDTPDVLTAPGDPSVSS